MSYSWDLIRNQVKEFRIKLQTIYPLQVFATVKDFVFDSSHNLYFLSDHLALTNEVNPGRQLHLYKINLDQAKMDWVHNDEELNATDYLAAYSQMTTLQWKNLFKEYSHGDSGTHFRVQGMDSFDIKDDTIMFTFKNDIYISKAEHIPKIIPFKPVYSYNESCERTDPKQGGNHNDMVAFIRERDIWITDFMGNERQLTFCSSDSQDPTLSCGGVEYMMKSFIDLPVIFGHPQTGMNQ